MKFANNNLTYSNPSGTLKLWDLGGKIAMFYDSSTGESGMASLEIASEAISKGNVVCSLIGGTTDKLSKVPTTGASHSMPVGVALTSASGDGQTFWMAMAGSKVQVLPDSTITAVKGYILASSPNTAGCVEHFNSAPVNDHWDEVGHWVKDGTGNGALTLAFIHFN